ncbi:MAG: hypothetical protein MI924_12480, partial [Chloroflexales bacterium]|nr:hypothetical protein [Chloroflexales bacterium]
MQNDTKYNDKRKKSGGSSWIGVIIFLLIIFGSQIVGPLSQFIAQISNNAIIINPRTLLPLLILGLVVVSVISSLARALFNASRKNDTYAPTSMPPPSLPSSL